MKPSLLTANIIIMYCNFFLKKNFLLYKIHVIYVSVNKIGCLDIMENLPNNRGKFGKIDLKNHDVLTFFQLKK